MVTINLESFKRADLISFVGRIDSSNASEMDAVFKDRLDNGRYRLVLDLNGINYMSSAGLRAMVAALRECKKHSGDVRIANPSERMADVLELAGLQDLFQVFEDATSAVGSY